MRVSGGMVGTLAVVFSVGCDSPMTSSGAPSLTVRGAVYDSVGRQLGGASVEVVGGGRANTWTLTDDVGQFALDVFGDPVTLRASKAGYRDDTKSFSSRDAMANRVLSFKLNSTQPPALRGNYLLTFTADRACASLPSEVRTRTYSTVIDANASSAVLSLGGAVFVQRDYSYNIIYLSQFEDFATLHFQDPEILERVTNRSYLRIYGTAEGTTVGSTTQLPFWGFFQFCPQQAGADYASCPVPVAVCESTNHTLTLSRQ